MVSLVKTGSVLFLCMTVAVFALGAGLLLGIGLMGGLQRTAPDQGPEHPVYTRDEFTGLVKGKTPQEVRKTMGDPAKTSVDPEAEYWHYRRCTRDPLTDRLDED